jgi:hypothetical protein
VRRNENKSNEHILMNLVESQAINRKYKIVIIIFFILLIVLMLFQQQKLCEGYDVFGGTENKVITDAELDYTLDNTLGDVLLEWDVEDTSGFLDEGALEGVMVHTLKCSRSCCPSQWPLPRELRDKGNMCGRDLVRSNFSCGNGSESGCVCLPRKIRDMMARRGNNATWRDYDI